MQLSMRLRAARLAAFSVCLAFASLSSSGAGPGRLAVTQPDAASAAEAVARGTAFVVNGTAFSSKQAFIDSGARCGARTVGTAKASAAQAREGVLTAQRSAMGAYLAVRPVATVVVPTVVHVISVGSTVLRGNVSQAAIEAQIQVLNNAFASTPFRFQLVDTTRTVNAAWYDMISSEAEVAAKTALRQGGVETLNIYLSNLTGGQLGYSYYPADAQAVGVLDGVVVLNTSVPGGTAAPYNQGDTAVHQVGHWLGLYHTFEGSCSGTGDLVADTAPEAAPAFGCPIGRNSCRVTRSGDPIFNFMNYTDDSCMDHFTRGQVVRMDAQHQLYRTPLAAAAPR